MTQTSSPEQTVDLAKILERTLKLLALSESSNEHEATSAAVAACRLIRKHELIVDIPGRTEKEAAPPEDDVFDADSEADVDWDAVEAAVASTKRPRRPQTSAQHSRRPTQHNPRSTGSRVYPGFIYKASTYEGACKWCGKRVQKNEWVLWAPRQYYHVACAQASREAVGEP